MSGDGPFDFRFFGLAIVLVPVISFASWLRDQVNDVEIPTRKPLTAQYIISTADDLDYGKICYRKDGTFSKESQLDPINQERFHDFVQMVTDKVSNRYPTRRVEIIPLFYSPHSESLDREPVNDIFSFINIYDPSASDWKDIWSSIFKQLFNRTNSRNIDESAVYVFINTAPFFENVIQLSELFFEMDEQGPSGESACPVRPDANVDSIFRYFRSLTMSSKQRELILELNMIIHDYYTNEYPKFKVRYFNSLIFLLPGILPALIQKGFTTTVIQKSFFFGAILGLMMPYFLNGMSYAKYEQNKRELVHWAIDKIPADQVSGLLTHLYRVQDNDIQALDCVRKTEFEGFHKKIGFCISEFGTMISRWVQIESPLAIPSRKEYIDSLLTHCRSRSRTENFELTPDPYEVYKDEEGFDYVFVT